jgi:hypothetical protein
MTTEQLQDLQQRALHAFQRDLHVLLAERPAQWVAYHGDQEVGFALHKHELYHQCFQRGLRREDFVIFCIEPQETEMTLGPVVLDWTVALFIDRLPFHCWTDSSRSPPLTYWTVVLPVMVTEPSLMVPPGISLVQEWVLDTGNRGEAFGWRHHLVLAGLDPDKGRLPQPMLIHTVTGKVRVPVRDVDLWLVSNIPNQPVQPYRMVLHRGLPFQDALTIPDPHFQRPLIGIRALRAAGLRLDIDFAHDTVSVWTPDSGAP